MSITVLFGASLIMTGFLLGAFFVALWMRARVAELDAARKLAELNLASGQGGSGKMVETFQAAADAALRATQTSFLEAARSTLETVRVEMTGDLSQRQTAVEGVVKPLADSLAKLDAQIRELESARQHVFGGLEQRLDT